MHCHIPATMHTGEMVRQADTPNTIATREHRQVEARVRVMQELGQSWG